MQTAAAYLWIGQCRRQLGHQHSANAVERVPKEFRKRNVTDMTRTLFIYRILACSASLLVLLCSTLPQLVLVVANPPKEGNLDQQWGWCHAFVYLDHVTRSFATYLIVVPYVIFFWDFLFSEVVPRKKLVMKQIFRGILFSAIPIALFSSVIAVPLVIFRYEKNAEGDLSICSSTIHGATNFLVFDFVVTRVGPTLIILVVTAAFLVWLPREHYGVFYEPLIFLTLMAPVVFLEATVYIACYMERAQYLVNSYFSDVLLIFYTFYHMSFSSTFVLATLRSVITEIRQEQRSRKQFLLGDAPRGDGRANARQGDVMLALQRQFSVVFRWRSECAEDELHLEEQILDKNKTTGTIKPISGEKLEDVKKPTDDVTLHYSILQRSATYKRTPTQTPKNPVTATTTTTLTKTPTTTAHSPTSSMRVKAHRESQRRRPHSDHYGSQGSPANNLHSGSGAAGRSIKAVPATPRSQRRNREATSGLKRQNPSSEQCFLFEHLSARHDEKTVGFEF